MPQVVIHISSNANPDNKSLLVNEMRRALVEILEISENVGQVILYEAPVQNRAAHESRDINFVFVETTMYPGRSHEMKGKLMSRFIYLVNKYTGVDEKDIILVIREVSPDNYFGGTSHKYIEDITKIYEDKPQV